MPALKCSQHEEEFDVRGATEHVRRFHASFVTRPGRPGEIDTHNHMWYCFGCSSNVKDHRSYDSDNAMSTHLRHNNHGTVVDRIMPF